MCEDCITKKINQLAYRQHRDTIDWNACISADAESLHLVCERKSGVLWVMFKHSMKVEWKCISNSIYEHTSQGMNRQNLIYRNGSRDTGAQGRQRAIARHRNGINYTEQLQPLGWGEQRKKTGVSSAETLQGNPRDLGSSFLRRGPPWLVQPPSEAWGRLHQAETHLRKGCMNSVPWVWEAYGN